jgi:diadenosine tetraphosphate (Ap4A) HIT family hydrolase
LTWQQSLCLDRERLLIEATADRFNIGVNVWLSGQTIEHAHVHVIPGGHGNVPDSRDGIARIIDEN